MRNSKIVALVAAAALLVVGAAFTAFAATGWVEEAGVWKYYDKNGEEVTESWAKSGADWYWLDENGELATDALVDEGTYYVDAAGKMVKNCWQLLANEDDLDLFGDEIWYYFQPSGKVLKGANAASKKTVNGTKYFFDEEGHMLFGWVKAGEGMVSDEENDAYKSADYYCGSNDDGAVRINKWEYLYIVNDDGDDDYAWFFFGTGGTKVTAAAGEKTWNGNKYIFDTYGKMLSEWVVASASGSTSSITTYKWFRSPEDGARMTKGWFYVIPQEDVDPDENEEENVHWFYADGKGNLYNSEIKSIGGKKYAFAVNGEMLSGLQWYDPSSADIFTGIDAGNIEDYTSWDSPKGDYETKTGLYFFSDDGENDGSMKMGAVKVDVDGDAWSFKFGTKGSKKGIGVTGKDGSYYYVNGAKITADGDLKVQAFPATSAGKSDMVITGEAEQLKSTPAADTYAVLTSTGAIVKSGNKTDADGYKYTVKDYYVTAVTDTNK